MTTVHWKTDGSLYDKLRAFADSLSHGYPLHFQILLPPAAAYALFENTRRREPCPLVKATKPHPHYTLTLSDDLTITILSDVNETVTNMGGLRPEIDK